MAPAHRLEAADGGQQQYRGLRLCRGGFALLRAGGVPRAADAQPAGDADGGDRRAGDLQPAFHHARRSEEHTSELQSLMRISYAVFCLNTKTNQYNSTQRIDTAT